MKPDRKVRNTSPLTDAQIERIRRDGESGVPNAVLARRFNVDPSTIGKIKGGRFGAAKKPESP